MGVFGGLTALWLAGGPAAAAPGDCHPGEGGAAAPWIEAPPGLIAVVAARSLGWAQPEVDHLAEHLAVDAAARAAPLGPAGGRWEGGAGPWGVELMGVAHAAHPEAEHRLRQGIAAALGPLALDPDRVAAELRVLRAEAPPSRALLVARAAARPGPGGDGAPGGAVEALRTDPGAWVRSAPSVVWLRPAPDNPGSGLAAMPEPDQVPPPPASAGSGPSGAVEPLRQGGRVVWALPRAARADAEAVELIGRGVALAAGGRSWSGWGPDGGVLVVEGARGERALERALRAPALGAARALGEAARRAEGPLARARRAAALGRCPRAPADLPGAARMWLGLTLPAAPAPEAPDRPGAPVAGAWTTARPPDPSSDPAAAAVRARRAAQAPGLWLEEAWGVWAQATGPGAEAALRRLLAPPRAAELRRARRAGPAGWVGERPAPGDWPSGPGPAHRVRPEPGVDPVEAALWLALPAAPDLDTELAVRAWADPRGGPLLDALARAGAAPHGHQLDLLRGEGLVWARVAFRSPADALGGALGAVDESRRRWALDRGEIAQDPLLLSIAVDLLAAAPGEALRRWARTGFGPYALDPAGQLDAAPSPGAAAGARGALGGAAGVWVLRGDPARIREALSRSGRSTPLPP